MLKQTLRAGLTLTVVAAATAAAYLLWQKNFYSPWTRDARVRADVIEVAPDVSGFVTAVEVHANQAVKQGDLMFSIDPERYRLRVEQAAATLEAVKTELALKLAEAHRRKRLDERVISHEELEAAKAAADAAQAKVVESETLLKSARLDLERTSVYATADGYITNLNVQVGDYAAAGQAMLALVDAHSFRVDGYFEESKIQAIRPGNPVRIRLLGGGPEFTGHVDSIARAIADTENQGLLSDVNPNFHWVRLAQRIPVRIALDQIPENLQLSAGMTCTVIVDTPDR